MREPTNISLRIKDVLSERGLTQKDLCLRLGISEVSLSRQLSKGSMSLGRLIDIANVINVDVRDLISEPIKNEARGYVEYNNKIYSFETLKKLKQIVDIIEQKESSEKYQKAKALEIKREEKSIERKIKPKAMPLFNDIVLDRFENYDATLLNCWSFRNGGDVRNNVTLDLGNMLSDYAFSVLGVPFLNSESAYIAGAYSLQGEEYCAIQKQLSTWKNGYTSKAIFRKQKNEYTKLLRKDWEQFNIQWMLFIVWEKCKSNESFRQILISIPKDAIIIENSTYVGVKDPAKSTSTIWGCWNEDLMAARKIIESDVENRTTLNNKKQIEYRKMIERNKINHVGVWKGKNLMGKILKLCQIALLTNIKPPINYNLLNSSGIFWFGVDIKEFLLQ